MNCANHPERENVAFCQNCGKPLCQECYRPVGSAVFCEPCLISRLGATAPPPPAGGYASTDPASAGGFTGARSSGATPGSYTYVDPVSGVGANGVIPPPPPPGSPNPWVAALLGFIPGVGAMYNEQYAKGIVHMAVFAILVSLSDHHGAFGLFVAGWLFYMVFEAYHTARARRDLLPLPNPFGLNDIGERLGFGKAWSGGSGAAHWSAPPPATADPAANPYSSTGFVPPPPPPWSAPPPPGYYGGPIPPIPPLPLDPGLTPAGNRFPTGAIVLIVLGILFLFGNSVWFSGFSGRYFIPILLIGLAVWNFVRRMTSSGLGLANDGAIGYQLRLFRALRASVWLALIGILFLLDDLNILSWSHSWPLFLILAAVMTLFRQAAYASVAPLPYGTPYPYPPAPTPAEPASTTIVPSSPAAQDDYEQEGR